MNDEPGNYPPFVSLNGKAVSLDNAKLSVFDRGTLIGHGVFDTALAVEDNIIWLDEHLTRFFNSQQALAIPQDFTRTELKALLEEAVHSHPALIKRVRITATAGESAMWGVTPEKNRAGSLIIIVTSADTNLSKPFNAALVNSDYATHWLSKHKTTSWLPYIAPAENALTAKGSNETLLLRSPSRGLLEFNNAGLLICLGDEVLSAPQELLFPSITLRKALTALEREGVTITSRELTLGDLRAADEVIGLNSLRLAFSLKSVTLTSPENQTETINFGAPSLAPKLRSLLLPKQFTGYFS